MAQTEILQPAAREDELLTSIIKEHLQQIFSKPYKPVGRRKNVEVMLLFFWKLTLKVHSLARLALERGSGFLIFLLWSKVFDWVKWTTISGAHGPNKAKQPFPKGSQAPRQHRLFFFLNCPEFALQAPFCDENTQRWPWPRGSALDCGGPEINQLEEKNLREWNLRLALSVWDGVLVNGGGSKLQTLSRSLCSLRKWN